MPEKPIIRAFFDEPTNTVSYLVADPATKQAAVIDPVLDYDQTVRRRRHPLGRNDAAHRQGAGLDHRVDARNPCPRRSSVRLALRQGQDRRQDRHRRAYQGRAADFPPRFRRRRFEDRRQRLRSSVRRRRAFQDRRTLPPRSSTRPGIRRPISPTRSKTPLLSAIRCSCPITAPRAPIFPAAMRTSFIARSGGCWRCRRRRGCSCATTTRRPAATHYAWETTVREEREHNMHVKDGVERGSIRRHAHRA